MISAPTACAAGPWSRIPKNGKNRKSGETFFPPHRLSGCMEPPFGPEPPPEPAENNAGGRADFEYLLIQARGGDLEARRLLLLHYRHHLKQLVKQRLRPEAPAPLDPSELVSSAMRWAWRHFPGFCGMSEREFLAWLEEILRRKLKSQLAEASAGPPFMPAFFEEAEAGSSARGRRRAAPMGTAGVAGAGLSGAQAALEEGKPEARADLLGRLPPEDQEVLTLRHVLRLKFADIAFRMGKPVEEIRKLWLRALERLRKLLEER